MKKRLSLLLPLLCWAALASAQEFWLQEDAAVVKQGSTGQLQIYFADDTEDYAGFQFDVNLPEGITVEKAEFYANRDYLDEGGTAHTVTINQNGTKCKLMCSAPNNIYQDLENGSDLLITLTLKAAVDMVPGSYQGMVDNIKFAKLYDPALGDRFITFDDVVFSLIVEENQLVVLDEDTTESPTAQQGVNVELRRTMYADKWNTFVLPFAVTSAQVKALFGEETKVASFQSVTEETDGMLTLHFATYNRSLAANTPYLLNPQNSGDSYVMEGVNIAPADAVVTKGAVSFIGTYVGGQPIPVGDYYLSDDSFYRSAGLSTMKAFRGYFHVESQQSARQLQLVLDNITLGGLSVATDASAAEGVIYGLDGVARPDRQLRGVVIVKNNNGMVKKIVG